MRQSHRLAFSLPCGHGRLTPVPGPLPFLKHAVEASADLRQPHALLRVTNHPIRADKASAGLQILAEPLQSPPSLHVSDGKQRSAYQSASENGKVQLYRSDSMHIFSSAIGVWSELWHGKHAGDRKRILQHDCIFIH